MSHQPPAAAPIVFRYRSGGQQFPFSVAAPYSEGHQLTRGEAQALNALRAERIRENCRPIFDDAASQEPSLIPGPEALADIQRRIGQYDASYQFVEKHEPRAKPEPLSPIEREALELARGEAPDGASEAEIELLAQTIELVSAATERVRIRAQIAASSLDDLR